jgi:hypothetical protein
MDSGAGHDFWSAAFASCCPLSISLRHALPSLIPEFSSPSTLFRLPPTIKSKICDVIFVKQGRLREIPEIIKGAAREWGSADATNRFGF